MKCLLIGNGEIGSGVNEVFGAVHDITVYDPINAPHEPEGDFDLLLVAIPYGPLFTEQVRMRQERHNVKGTIVFSTVPIGTCSALGASHAPVEGKHPDLAESMRKRMFLVGGYAPLVDGFFNAGEPWFVLVDKPEYTEFLKLRSTTLYGLNIEFARYSKAVCDELGMDYEWVEVWDNGVNHLYSMLGMPEYTRYILDPPDGPKGGHCVTPNAKLLYEQYPSVMVKVVAEDGGVDCG